ncbi:hypothetical protein [Streptomyces sp. BH105]|uniref:hypothetical protein n=1 Tax=Streptomyces sp. BH105 TaxID=3410408 RepID=UPI003CF2F6B1
MSTTRRPLGRGPQPLAAALATGDTSRPILASEADLESTPLYEDGLDNLARLRARGVLGVPARPTSTG